MTPSRIALVFRKTACSIVGRFKAQDEIPRVGQHIDRRKKENACTFHILRLHQSIDVYHQ